MLSRTTRLRYLPRAMHAAYVAKDKGVVGRVNWQFLPRALKSFTGHYKSGPTTIGFTPMRVKTRNWPRLKIIEEAKKTPRGQPLRRPCLCTY